ncbi:Predicted acetyltransferase [Nakamurella panacisegetis]|uniref:Predicted acetyltransferase n=1 Tax=Nakamurella panacisegetis TaxID=1090615 RepID=A0A1H0T5G8_9ACTN|nr:GNAT family N-acetyltransferase [Nakamurella panacisegetis]SDP49000.1 Predicted acetyltransferase [Nakamurella panacisegetis]
MTGTHDQPPAPTSTTGAGGFVVRALSDTSEADWAAATRVDALAFGYVPDADYLDRFLRPQYDLGRFTGVFDPALGDLMVGLGGIQSRSLTFPGRGPSPVAAVTWVAVRPDQQRRGALRHVMTHQLHADGIEPIAVLTASEAGIYGRFGYGLATNRTRREITTPARLRPGTVTDPVLEMPRAEAMPLMRAIHDRVRPVAVGYLDRTDAVWEHLLSEHPFAAAGRPARRFVLHPDGYLSFRVADSFGDGGPDSKLTVGEICAATPAARASLWRHVLSYPLVRTVQVPLAGVDEPLIDLLDDPRALSTAVSDHVWVRLVRLTDAIDRRTYSATARVTVAVTDRFCPWNDGVFALDLDADGGRAHQVDDEPEIRCDIADLGSAFLGGTRIARLATAGRVTGDPAAIGRLDAAMATPLRPFTPEGF